MKNAVLASFLFLSCGYAVTAGAGALGPGLADGFPAYGKRCQGHGTQGDYDVRFKTTPLSSGDTQLSVALSIDGQEIFGPTGGFAVEAPGLFHHRHYYKVWSVAVSSQFLVPDAADSEDESIPIRYVDGAGGEDEFEATCTPLSK